VKQQQPPESRLLVDESGRAIGECTLPSVIGRRAPLLARLVSALPTNKSGPVPIKPGRWLVDSADFAVADSDGNLIGRHAALWVHRLLTARRTNRMPISRRYTPEKDPAEECPFGLSFEYVIPKGVGIAKGELDIFYNSNPPVAADSDWEKGPVTIAGRLLYATLGRGLDGTDYILQWTATDTDGNVWPRATLVLCAMTS
jgi:hypothetical protein